MAPAAKRARKEAEEAAAKAAAEQNADDDEEEEEESEEGEGEEEEMELTIDEDGRVALPGSEKEPNYGFRCFPGMLQRLLGEEASAGSSWKAFRQDCQAAFTARAAEGAQYSSGETFWVGAAEEPTTLIEKLALAIFKLHTRGCTFEPDTSGAEWWTQVIDADDDIGWHWDRDYGLEEKTNFRLHPHVASVSYASDLGAPTLILEAVEEPRPKEEGGEQLDVRVAHWSAPRVGKHISFDGRWLHGAPADLAVHNGGKSGAGVKRMTFLVNVWLNHKPLNVVECKLPSKLSTGSLKAAEDVLQAAEAEAVVPSIWCKGGALDHFSWDFGADSDDEGEEEEKDEEADADKAGKRKVKLGLPLKEVREKHGKDARLPDAFSVMLGKGLCSISGDLPMMTMCGGCDGTGGCTEHAPAAPGCADLGCGDPDCGEDHGQGHGAGADAGQGHGA